MFLPASRYANHNINNDNRCLCCLLHVNSRTPPESGWRSYKRDLKSLRAGLTLRFHLIIYRYAFKAILSGLTAIKASASSAVGELMDYFHKFDIRAASWLIPFRRSMEVKYFVTLRVFFSAFMFRWSRSRLRTRFRTISDEKCFAQKISHSNTVEKVNWKRHVSLRAHRSLTQQLNLD